MSNRDAEMFWIESCENHYLPKSFVRIVQVFSEQTATTNKITRLVANLVPVVLMNASSPYRRRFLKNGLTLLVFLPVTMKICEDNRRHENSDRKQPKDYFTEKNKNEVEEKTRQIGPRIMRDLKMKLLYEAMMEMLKRLVECGSTGFEI